MAIKDIIARGIGFSPASVKFIVTHGLAPSSAVGRPRRIIYRRIRHTTVPVETFVEQQIAEAEPVTTQIPEFMGKMFEPVDIPQLTPFSAPQLPIDTEVRLALRRMEEEEEDAIIALLLAA